MSIFRIVVLDCGGEDCLCLSDGFGYLRSELEHFCSRPQGGATAAVFGLHRVAHRGPGGAAQLHGCLAPFLLVRRVSAPETSWNLTGITGLFLSNCILWSAGAGFKYRCSSTYKLSTYKLSDTWMKSTVCLKCVHWAPVSRPQHQIFFLRPNSA